MAERQAKEVRVKGTYIDIYSFEGSLDNIIDRLIGIRDDAMNGGYKDIRIKLERQGYGDSYYNYDVLGKRMETDAEMNKRIKAAKKKREANAKMKATLKEKRRKKYEQLKKEFDDE